MRVYTFSLWRGERAELLACTITEVAPISCISRNQPFSNKTPPRPASQLSPRNHCCLDIWTLSVIVRRAFGKKKTIWGRLRTKKAVCRPRSILLAVELQEVHLYIVFVTSRRWDTYYSRHWAQQLAMMYCGWFFIQLRWTTYTTHLPGNATKTTVNDHE